tara:strand:- start:178 stop:717 length:540 start_codon:yes stop_codon:yes gene_type:complete
MFKFIDNLKKSLESLNKKNFISIISIIIIIFIIIYILYYCINNNKNNNLITGGNTCDVNYITAITPDENKIVIYYAGKIYDIKKKELRTEQLIYFDYLQKLVKEGYEFDKTPENQDDKEIYSIKHYKDLTKFFNYYELYKAEGRNMTKWENLYNSKDSIIEMLKNNINVKDIICINNIK